jgi:hypothetical protein
MIAGARDLHIVISGFPANVAAVVLVRWNDAAAWSVFAGFWFGSWHVISLSSFGSRKYVGLSSFLVRTAIAGDQTGYRNRDVEHAGDRFESGHHA